MDARGAGRCQCRDESRGPHELRGVLRRDSWGRPVYECDGRLYVDVDPRRSRPADICTKQGNAFDGEPCDPVPERTIIEFVPKRDTWDF